MNANLTELVFILDRSGSMAGLEKDTIGGMNALLQQQKEAPGQALVTTVLFDHETMLLHDRIDLRAVAPLTPQDYQVRGMTALLDAVGSAIEKISAAHVHTAEEYRPGHVLFVITTDGFENASRRYTAAGIKELIAAKKHLGWEFLFLGANIDAVKTAGGLGIDASRAANYHADTIGTRTNFEAVSEATCAFRAAPVGASMDSGWKTKISRDFESRKKKR